MAPHPLGYASCALSAGETTPKLAIMGWFGRKKNDRGASPAEPTAGSPDIELIDDLPTRATSTSLSGKDEARITTALGWLAEVQVDVDDAGSLGAAYDAALAGLDGAGATLSADELIEVFGVGLGEHVRRHTDFVWAQITDCYGSDLGLMGRYDDMVLVPHTMVGARALNRERGWIPGVAAHLVRIRRR